MTDTFSGNVGLAISQALILTGMVQYGIRQCAETMQQMTSVERIIEYSNLEPVINLSVVKDICYTQILTLFLKTALRYSTGTQSRPRATS